jgi:HEAT repeat protein
VRHAAAAGLRELAEVLPGGDEALTHNLRSRLASPDPVIRCAVLDVLREIRAGAAGVFAAALADDDHRVRLCAVRGLVSVGEAGLVAQAAADQSREVRVGVADGLALLRPGEQLRQGLELLAGDPDPLVRAAAFKAAGAVGCPPPLDALAALAIGPLAETAWQARAGAAQALAAADPAVAVAPLVRAAADPHPDVRKAAVIALASMRTDPAAAGVRRAAAADSDADVRAYARQAALP